MEKVKRKKLGRRILSFVLSAVLAVGLIPGTVRTAYAADDITVTIDTGDSVTLQDTDSDGYYEIGTADDLYAFAAAVNAGNTSINGKLTADIDMTGKAWTPICQTLSFHASEASDTGYCGTFDGNGHTISNLTVTFNSSGTSNTYSHGLFGTVSGTVKNLGMLNLKYQNTEGDTRAGSVAGQLLTDGTITNCYSVGHSIETNSNIAGGIVGCNYGGTISNCYAINGTVTGYSDRWGGVVGDCQKDDGTVPGTVSNCYTDTAGARVVSSQSGNAIVTECEVKNTDAFASGEVAYLLNGDQSTITWYQTLETDTYPVLNSEHGTVYRGYDRCKAVYANAAGELPEEPEEHVGWTNSKCTYCGTACSHEWDSNGCSICDLEGKVAGAFILEGGEEGTDYTYANGVLTIKTATSMTIRNIEPTVATTDTIVIETGVSANITLAGVKIDVSETANACAFKIGDNSTGNVTITLADGSSNSLVSGRYCAGLQKNGTAGTLTIGGSVEGTGSLTAQSVWYAAGIGGGNGCSGSGIVIEGGTVTATGGENGAGIGGGYDGSGSGITIEGGTVTANGGERGAGIGGGSGSGGSGSDILVEGGIVTATGGANGAGIGGGCDGSGSGIIIEGGIVTANGGRNGAGIGGGADGSGSNIIIKGGSVKVTKGKNANAIGGGLNNSAVTPTLEDGTPVYLLTVQNANSENIIINGEDYPTAHGEDKAIYVYFPANVNESKTITVQVGNVTTTYGCSTESGKWLKPIEVPEEDTREFVYDGNPKTYQITTSDAYTISNNTTQTNAGTYIVTVTRNDAENTMWSDGTTGVKEFTFEIQKADSAVASAPTVKSGLTYTGSQQVLIEGGSATNGTMQYSLSEDGTYSETIPEGTNAGDYTVYYKVVGDTNYKDTAVENISVTIAQAVPDLGEVTGTDLVLISEPTDASVLVQNIQRTNNAIAGTFEITDAEVVYGTHTYNWRFTPESSNYKTITGTVTIKVTKEPETVDSVCWISNASELLWFVETVNDGQTAINAKLIADIDLSGIDWTMMSSFAGTFDGNGYTISGLNNHIDLWNNANVHGFIRTLADGGFVKNLTFTGAKVFNHEGSGATSAVIAYTNNGTVENCTVKNSSIHHGSYDALGVVVGVNAGTIRNCASISNTITRRYSANKNVCGFVWSNSGNIENCFNFDCTYQNGSDRYAFTQSNTGTITNCYYYEASETLSDTITNGVIEVKSSDQFASGEVAYLLNGDQSTITWYQTLETDTYPVLDSEREKVYRVNKYDCPDDNEAEYFYSNTNEEIRGTMHSFVDGECTGCGIKKELTITLDAGGDFAEGEYTFANNVHTINTDKAVTITGTTTIETVVIAKDVSANVTLNNVSINVSGTDNACAFKIEDNSTGSVKITLADGSTNILKSGIKCAGLQKNGADGTLTIEGTGILEATSKKYGAGIGGGWQGAGTGITINGGTIEATGGESGAGIGGGYQGSASGITISGGIVTATSKDYGAGVGGGDQGNASGITINGGIVTATGGASGAGIGGGNLGNASEITISGGTVTAIGGSERGAGIGGGWQKAGTKIIISGGSVKVTCGVEANAIGGGEGASATTPTTGGASPKDVYLLTIANPESKAVVIDGVAYAPKNHTAADANDTNLYVYLPAKTVQTPNEVTIGSTTTKYTYDTTNSKWLTVVDAPDEDTTIFTYNGEEQTYTLAESDYYTITGNKQTNTGTYTVTIALNDKDSTVWNDGTTDDKEYTFTIAKADAAVTWNDQSVASTGEEVVITAPTLTFIGNDNPEVDLTYSYKAQGDEEYTTGLPSDCGTYDVKVNVSATDNYGAVEDTMTLIITCIDADKNCACDNCEYTLEHEDGDEDGYCDICKTIINGKAALRGRTLVLGGDIGVVFYFDLVDAMKAETTRVDFTLANGKTSSISFSDIRTYEEDDKTYYGFMCRVHATEMNQLITAKLYDGETLLSTHEYSVEQYCTNQLDKLDPTADAEIIAVINSLVLYGGMSQTYFGKNTDDLVSEDFSDLSLAELTADEKTELANYQKIVTTHNENAGISSLGMSLVLFSETSMRAYFTLEEGYSMDDFTFEVTNQSASTDITGSCIFGKNASGSYLEITGIGATNLDSTYVIVVKDKEGASVLQIEYSAFAYINNKLAYVDSNMATATDEENVELTNLKNVITAMYRYNKAAEAYAE